MLHKEIYNYDPQLFFEELRHTTMKIFNCVPTYLSADKITLDIGACIGVTASFFNKYSKEVHCFEALPFHAQLLRERNYPKIVVYETALSDTEEEVDFYVLDGSSTFLPTSKFQYDEFIKVKTRTLDSYNFTDVGFIKIDVEGAELKVLKGARKTIETSRPPITIEIIQDQLRHSAQDIFDFLKDYGYTSYYFYEGLKRVEDMTVVDIMQSTLQTYDILFLPEGVKP
jgi:FkbM family methyltransferase